MANHDTIVSSDKLSAIADAIRDKTGKSDTLTLDQMPEEIESISGGGATPTCGIVPTSWSPNGFVLSANTYGDIASYAFAGDERIMHGYNPTADSITALPPESSSYYRSPIYDYLRRVQLMTVPSIIGDCAFKYCRWLNIDSLPEGLETIGAEAFSYCSSSQITEIPSTVKLIRSRAFSYIRDSNGMCADYDSHTSYNIGDVVLSPSGYQVTCIVNISIPEEYNENHWVQGNYPQVLGIYDPDISYSTGDIVANNLNINTCLSHYMSTQYKEGYYPGVVGVYSPTHTYHIGDVVFSTDYYMDPYTCVVDNPSDISSSDWVSGYYPNILGLYTPGANYTIGDMVIYDNYSYTCCVPISDAGSFDDIYWVNGQCPQLLGIYDSAITYHLGDVVCIASGYGSYDIYTCIVNSSSTPDQFDQEWYHGYCPTVLGQFGDQLTYDIGDVVIYDSSMYTCRNTTSGDEFIYDDWISDYYPEAIAQSAATNVGDICILDTGGGSYSPYTVYQAAGIVATLIPGCYPTLIGEYDSTQAYSAGDLVVQFDSDYSSSSIYLNLSHIPIIADLNDSNYWESISSDYYGYTLTFLGTPEYIYDDAISSDSYDMVLFPFGVRDAFYGSMYRDIYLYNRICTGYSIIAPDVLVIGTDNSVKFMHTTSTDLSQTDWGNEYSVSAENATISWSDSTYTYIVTPDSGLTSGDIVSITVTSAEDSSLSTTFTIPVDFPSISFDPLSSSWHTDGEYSGNIVYSCTRSADNNICEFTVCGYSKLQIYTRFVREQSYQYLPMYLGNIDSSVSASSYNSVTTISNYSWGNYIEYDIAGQVDDVWEPHSLQILLPQYEDSYYYNTLQIYIVGVA